MSTDIETRGIQVIEPPRGWPRPNIGEVWRYRDLVYFLARRDIGGLGVFLVQELADRIDYQRSDGCNILRITLRLVAAHDMESKA